MENLAPYAHFILIVFILGYACITLEHFIKINKTATALLMSVLTWVLLFANRVCIEKNNLECFLEQLSDNSQIVFFLLGALIIVETINKHQGFNLITNYIHFSSRKVLFWVLGFFTFFLSSILDNLTTTIVMVTLLDKILPKNEERHVMGGGIVIAANAGGVWTPIGDVTTTMMWIGGQLTAPGMMWDLFLPSLVSMLVSFGMLTPQIKEKKLPVSFEKQPETSFGRSVFVLGIATLIFVPIFKSVTGLPPFMGILFGVSVLWIYTDLIHSFFDHDEHLKMPSVLSRIDLSSTLFFLGILLCVDALNMANILEVMANWLDKSIGNISVIATLIGLISAIVDNVPLVAAAMRMYDISQHAVDSQFWQLVAFCAGTGGSILVIGSAAGIVYMGIEKIDFFWYLRKISLAALVGYFVGIGTYLLFHFPS